MPAHAPARLIDRLGLTHDVTMDGDLAAGGVIFAERSD
jgi:hypothetical protein